MNQASKRTDKLASDSHINPRRSLRSASRQARWANTEVSRVSLAERGSIPIFWRKEALTCGEVGLYAGDVGLYAGLVGEY